MYTAVTTVNVQCYNGQKFKYTDLVNVHGRYHGAQIQDFYEMDKGKLGEGSYGSVTKAKNKLTGAVRVVKSVTNGDVDRFFLREFAIMKMTDHPNIVKLYESFKDHNNIYLVMEHCSGGDLFDWIVEAGHFVERHAASLVQQMLSAVAYCHAHCVCHRDLKPENLLLMTRHAGEYGVLKIGDFGLSCTYSEDQVLPFTTKLGSPHYVSPQVLSGRYDQMCDMWSSGVIMYMLLCGYQPFPGDTDAEVLSKVRLGKFSFVGHVWTSISDNGKDLISNLLKVNPYNRYTAERALRHDWINNLTEANNESVLEYVLDVCTQAPRLSTGTANGSPCSTWGTKVCLSTLEGLSSTWGTNVCLSTLDIDSICSTASPCTTRGSPCDTPRFYQLPII